jgi:hypothetical protein
VCDGGERSQILIGCCLAGLVGGSATALFFECSKKLGAHISLISKYLLSHLQDCNKNML